MAADAAGPNPLVPGGLRASNTRTGPVKLDIFLPELYMLLYPLHPSFPPRLAANIVLPGDLSKRNYMKYLVLCTLRQSGLQLKTQVLTLPALRVPHSANIHVSISKEPYM